MSVLLNSKTKLSLLLFCTFFHALPASAQNNEAIPSNSSNIFFELGGNGILFSLNYDQRFTKTNKGIGGRIGLGYIPSITHGSTSGVVIPIAVNYLTEGPHCFEAGAGVTIGFTNRQGNEIVFVPSAGYRYQPNRPGFTFRMFVSPLIFSGISIGGAFWGGLSIGMRF